MPLKTATPPINIGRYSIEKVPDLRSKGAIHLHSLLLVFIHHDMMNERALK
jgi:hypothetical protein